MKLVNMNKMLQGECFVWTARCLVGHACNFRTMQFIFLAEAAQI